MRYFFVFLLLIFCSFQSIVAQNNLRKQIGDSLTVYANAEMWVGKITVKNLAINNHEKIIEITTNENLSYLPFREDNVAELYNVIKKALPATYAQYTIYCKAGNNRIEALIPNYYRSKQKDTKRQFKISATQPPLLQNLSLPYEINHGLQGRHLAIWPSHGYYYSQETPRWEWQRPRLYQTVEDLYTTGYVLPFLVPMLENAGANVLIPRERDIQTEEVIVDNDTLYYGSSYTEQNNENIWQAGATPGFAHVRDFYIHAENPFTLGTYRWTQTVTSADNASCIEWAPAIRQSGEYAVYVSYQTVDNSTADAQYTVCHAGGETTFKVNQNMYGGTWLYLGHFYFKAGDPKNTWVRLSNYSHEKGKIITADAVKFGGGMGNIARQPYMIDSTAMRIMAAAPANGKTKKDTIIRIPSPSYTQEISGYPRFMEGSRYWLQWAGAPDSIYSRTKGENDYSDDFQSRGYWVNYISGGSPVALKEKGLKVPVDMALGFHTDAGVTPNDSIIGTLGLFTTRNSNKEYSYKNGVSRLSSRDLTDLIQSQIVADIRTAYNPEWSSRGIWDRSMSESRVPEVPTMLLELLSHQNFADMRYGLDPAFRFTVCRAIYKGILKYFESIYNEEYIVQPLPVQNFSIQFAEENKIRLEWQPTDDLLEATAKAKHYVVYTRIDGGGFDNGTLVKSNHYTTKIEPDKIYSFKIAAVNEGGSSFPSEILSAARASGSAGEVLVINGFDRISAPTSFMQDTTFAGFLNMEDAGVPYIKDISFVGSQHDFKRDTPFINNDSPGVGASYGEYENQVIAGNTFDYPYIHGQAIMQAGYSFVSCSKYAVMNGTIDLGNYPAIDLILGKQRKTLGGNGELRAEFQTFPLDLQYRIESYCLNGGNIMVSGAYFASDMHQPLPNDSTDGKAFLENVLKCRLVTAKASAADKIKITGSPLKVFQKSKLSYYNEPNSVSYYIESPDAIEPVDKNGYTICRFEENNFSAGVAYNNGNYRICAFVFPFETIKEEGERNKLMEASLKFLMQK